MSFLRAEAGVLHLRVPDWSGRTLDNLMDEHIADQGQRSLTRAAEDRGGAAAARQWLPSYLGGPGVPGQHPVLLPGLKEPGPGSLPTSWTGSLVRPCHLGLLSEARALCDR